MNEILEDADNKAVQWLNKRRRLESFELVFLALEQSKEWALSRGKIRHRSGRFFKVVGVRSQLAFGTETVFPMLDQREVGTLSVIARRQAKGTQLLIQGKAEPGNVGVVQFAPTYQATASNTDRVHGGEAPPLYSWYRDCPQQPLQQNCLQSEQGSRFWQKRNRNVLFEIQDDLRIGETHCWFPMAQIAGLVTADHVLNTDLRSVLVCGDWRLLAGGEPFAGTGFAAELHRSMVASDADSCLPMAAIFSALEGKAPWLLRPVLCDLSELSSGGGSSLQATPGLCPYEVKHIGVRLDSREVPRWDQPIVQSKGCGEVVLPLGRLNGVVHFLFRLCAEPGFGDRLEFTPALVVEPGASASPSAALSSLLSRSVELASCRQSDEGGRFLWDESVYRLCDVGAVVPMTEDYRWLTLAQIRVLLDRGLSFTNEARSTLSFLLQWL